MSTPHAQLPASEALPESFRTLLNSVSLLGDLATWHTARIREGGVGGNTFSLTRGDQKLFLKETRANESRTLKLLHRQKLRLAPVIHAPELLDQNILLAEFIPGDKPTCKRLDPLLIHDFAQMQNALNDPQIFAEGRAPAGCKFTDHDDGFFQRGLVKNSALAEQNIAALKRFNLPIVDELQAAAGQILPRIDTLAAQFAAMPFAWQHHDCREGNILGTPQRLVDWGSSYGHGPFLFDLAPFLIDDPAGWTTFIGASDHARKSSPAALHHWLRLALAARFVAFIKERIKPNGGHVNTAGQTQAFLEYEFAPFRALSDLKL